MSSLPTIDTNFSYNFFISRYSSDASKEVQTEDKINEGQKHWQKLNKLDGVSEKRNEEDKGSKISLSKEVDPQEQIKIQKLKSIDAHVKAHERAHVAAGGPYVRGGPTYTYVVGPDGNRYAVAGEVKIDTSPVPNNPDATIRKAQVIKRAALAPSDPSPQDRAVAARADQMAMKAKIEKLKEQTEKMKDILDKDKNFFQLEKDKGSDEESIDISDYIIQGPSGAATLKRIIRSYGVHSPLSNSIHYIV